MSEIADRYRKRAAGFTARVEAAPEDRWESPSPRREWTARDVVLHVVDTSGMFLGFIGRDAPQGPSADVDPAGAWTAARDAIQAALDDPATATLEYEGRLGRSTFERGWSGSFRPTRSCTRATSRGRQVWTRASIPTTCTHRSDP